MKDIILPSTVIDHEQIMYSILELINNSLRAHREHRVSDDIFLHFAVDGPRLKILIQDNGRGFDPRSLPYKLDSNVSDVNLHSEDFQKYRETNGYKRFGMGLFITKKTFEFFRLNFLDQNGNPVDWESGKVKSTRIELGTYLRRGTR
ncbi:MAG: ATP-binding protein [Spirochaetales bacterium]|nr:ATP-binding protein [Spirochaetales bacterium]